MGNDFYEYTNPDGDCIDAYGYPDGVDIKVYSAEDGTMIPIAELPNFIRFLQGVLDAGQK